MDIVYVCRAGENRELRYSLRSVSANVAHERVHIVGGWPPWISPAVHLHERPTLGTKYLTTTAHVRYACGAPEISDPFILFNDDFFALEQVPEIRPMHRGDVDSVLRRYRTLNSPWARGMRATAQHLRATFPDRLLYSYEVHVPMIIHKEKMIMALDMAEAMAIPAPHKRTIYGNVAELGGEMIVDPKIDRNSTRLPDGPWLSTDDSRFPVVMTRLNRRFPNPCSYEDQVS